MEALLNERVESEVVISSTAMERCGRLNRLIGDGLYTITKRRHGAETITQTTSQNVTSVPASIPVSYYFK